MFEKDYRKVEKKLMKKFCGYIEKEWGGPERGCQMEGKKIEA